MQTQETIFEKTYKNYLEQLREISFKSVAHNLGAKIVGNRIKIPLTLTTLTLLRTSVQPTVYFSEKLLENRINRHAGF